MKIAVLIPAYNAEKEIGKVFDRIPSGMTEKLKIIVVNDGSMDKTEHVIKKLGKSHDISLISHGKKSGYGAAQKTGFREALKEGADITVLLHADGQYPPEKIGSLIAPIRDGECDIVCGSRHLGGDMLKQGMPKTKYAGNIFLTGLENMVFGKNLSCYHSGFRAYGRKALERINFGNYSNYFHFDSEMLLGAFRNNLRIKEIPIPTHYGNEVSHLNPIKYGIGILNVILKYILGRY